jgi:hypothetical protein
MGKKMNLIEKKIKSLDEHINNLVSKFDYPDFTPEIDNHALLKKFEALFKENNYYWDFYEPKDKWTRWLFIQFKSFESTKQVKLGMNFSNNEIHCVIFEYYSGANFEPKHAESEISIPKIWLNHDYLRKELIQVINKGIEVANPSVKTG